MSANSRPAVSVVIPLFDKGDSVRRAIESVLAQTMRDFELVVVNDGSTDDGPAIVQGMDDARLRLVSQENRGVSAARNRGIDEARAQFVAFLDADDEWRPTFLHTISRLVQTWPGAGIYATGYRIVDRRGSRPARIVASFPGGGEEGVLENYFRSAWAGKSPVSASSACVPKSVLDQVGGFPVGIRQGEDTGLWARIALRHAVVLSLRCEAVYHQFAGASHASHRYFGRDAVFDFGSLLAGQSQFPFRHDLEKYVARRLLELALHALLHGGDRECARAILNQVPGSHLRGRRTLIRALQYTPHRVGKGMFLFGQALRKLWRAASGAAGVETLDSADGGM